MLPLQSQSIYVLLVNYCNFVDYQTYEYPQASAEFHKTSATSIHFDCMEQTLLLKSRVLLCYSYIALQVGEFLLQIITGMVDPNPAIISRSKIKQLLYLKNAGVRAFSIIWKLNPLSSP